MSEFVLKIRNLFKTYSDGTQALKGINLDIKKGEFIAIIGLSGSGKSTLIRCMNRLHDPTTGQIFFNNQDIASTNSSSEIRALRRNIAMIFQHFNLIPRHTAFSNVLIGRLGSMGTFKSLFGFFSEKDKSDAMKYLTLVGIPEKAKARADSLSGGQQQRVAIARALMQEPQVLLADEPVSSLDPATSQIIMNYLKKVNKELGITVIVNLHSLPLVRQYASRVVALKGGEIIFDGIPSEINDEKIKNIYSQSTEEAQDKPESLL